jgi:putative transposase
MSHIMSYTTNPNMPRVRQRGAALVKRGWSARKVGRYLGYHHTAVIKWVRKAKRIGYHPIPTKSSRPHHHPNELSEDVIERIVELRLKTKRTYEVVHKCLENEGIKISASSVLRTFDRRNLLKKRSPYKRFHPHVDRPKLERPGSLVQIDAIHLMTGPTSRIYVLTLIDVYSRQTYARCYRKLNSKTSVSFLNEAESQSVFDFEMIQTDHGSEFGKWFVERIKRNHRYSRIGKPNDNSHIERFNRTIREECLDTLPRNVGVINSKMKEYLQYYNNERLHMGINLKPPVQIISEWCQAIG